MDEESVRQPCMLCSFRKVAMFLSIFGLYLNHSESSSVGGGVGVGGGRDEKSCAYLVKEVLAHRLPGDPLRWVPERSMARGIVGR